MSKERLNALLPGHHLMAVNEDGESFLLAPEGGEIGSVVSGDCLMPPRPVQYVLGHGIWRKPRKDDPSPEEILGRARVIIAPGERDLSPSPRDPDGEALPS